MKQEVKTILIIAGVIAGVAAITLTIYFVVKQKNNQGQGDSITTSPSSLDEQLNNGTNVSVTPPAQTQNFLIAPKFNEEGELSNSLVQLKGRTIYPKSKAQGGWDYATIRSSAQVNTSGGWWDPTNELKTIYVGSPIGTVLSDTTSVHNGYPYRWFKVKLSEAISGFFSNTTEGFVRADTVTFKGV